MRGSPPIQLFLLLLAFVLVGVTLAKLTGNEAVKAETEVKEVKALEMTVRLNWSGKLEKLSLKHEGRELATGVDLSGEEAEFDLTAPVSKTGLELMLDAKWAAGTPKTALSVEAEPDGQDARALVHWTTDAAMNEVLIFTW